MRLSSTASINITGQLFSPVNKQWNFINRLDLFNLFSKLHDGDYDSGMNALSVVDKQKQNLSFVARLHHKPSSLFGGESSSIPYLTWNIIGCELNHSPGFFSCNSRFTAHMITPLLLFNRASSVVCGNKAERMWKLNTTGRISWGWLKIFLGYIIWK